MKQKIQVGDLVYRIYKNGHKSPGIAASILSIRGQFPYRWDDTTLPFNAFFALENYTEDDKDMSYMYDGYGKGDYEYQLIPAAETKRLAHLLRNMKNVPYLSKKEYSFNV